jgi:hypothetical protein
MRKRRITIAVVAVVVISVALGVVILAERARVAEMDREERRLQREARAEQRERERREQLREESVTLVPEELGGVALGMTQDEVRGLRTGIRPKLGATDLGLTLFEERLRNGAEVIYGFGEGEAGLVQIQVMSALPSTDALAMHFDAMIERYGRPTGVWDCPDTGGVATRRFTWRKSRTTVSDVFLLYGDRASVTLFIAPSEATAVSLQRSRCQPVRDRAQLEAFPVTTLEQIRRTQEAEGAGTPRMP